VRQIASSWCVTSREQFDLYEDFFDPPFTVPVPMRPASTDTVAVTPLPPPPPDGNLVDRLARGDGHAFAQLRTRYEMTLYAEAFRLLLDPVDSTAVVESVFVELVRSAGSIPFPHGSGDVHHWLVQRTRSLARATLTTRGMRDPIISPSPIPA
jgi:hypothetical protein